MLRRLIRNYWFFFDKLALKCKSTTKTKTKKNLSISNILDKYNNRYNLVMINNKNPVILDKIQKKQKQQLINKVINNININFNEKLNKKYKTSINNNVLFYDYNNIYLVKTKFSLQDNHNKLDFDLHLIMVSESEYYISNLKLIKNIELSEKYRKSFLYNKWLV